MVSVSQVSTVWPAVDPSTPQKTEMVLGDSVDWMEDASVALG